jgi:uroporphyrinogen decarboxylase
MIKPETSFERVLTAIRREEPDRVPNAEVWIAPEVKDAFMDRSIRSIKDDVAFWRAAGYDFIALDADLYATPQVQQEILSPHSDTAHTYSEVAEDRNWVSSKAGAIQTWEDIKNFPWPTADDIDYSKFEEVKPHLGSDMKTLVTFGHVFTAVWQLMGFETFCTTLIEDPGLVREAMQKLGAETLRLLERVLSYDSVGVMCFQDDIAYTNGMMVSPTHLKEIFFPWLQRAAEICHSAACPMLFHSDGQLDDVLPDIVASGVDGIQAIEPKCMDIAAVKRGFGHKLALMGNVDLNYTLTRGTAQEVAEEVKNIIRDAGPGGGLLVGSANSVTNYVPMENYKAMLEAVRQYGRYPIAG